MRQVPMALMLVQEWALAVQVQAWPLTCRQLDSERSSLDGKRLVLIYLWAPCLSPVRPKLSICRVAGLV